MSIDRLIEKLDTTKAEFDTRTKLLPSECAKFAHLTRLIRLPEASLHDGVQRATFFVRKQARTVLSKIGQDCGLVVFFLCTQATNETRLGRLDPQDVTPALLRWYDRTSFSASLSAIAERIGHDYDLKYPAVPGWLHTRSTRIRCHLTSTLR